jgi:hypothetical protein
VAGTKNQTQRNGGRPAKSTSGVRSNPFVDAQAMRLLEGRNIWTGQRVPRAAPAIRPPSRTKTWLDDPRVRERGYDLARQVGGVAGVGRGAWHGVKGLGEGVALVARLANGEPFTPFEDKAAVQLGRAGIAAVRYIGAGARDPRIFGRDLRRAVQKANVDLNPNASPRAKTFAGELERNFKIGQNQGELAFNVASAARGGPIIDTIAAAARVKKTVTAAQLAAKGYDPRLIDYFNEPYTGRGHHSPGIRFGLPKSVRDNRYFLLRPPGMTKGDFYQLHAEVDSFYGGGRVPRKYGGGGWAAKDFGWETYGLPGRLLYGTTTPLKSALIRTATGAGVADQTYSMELPALEN